MSETLTWKQIKVASNQLISNINTCEIPGEDFIMFFTASSVSKRMENGVDTNSK